MCAVTERDRFEAFFKKEYGTDPAPFRKGEKYLVLYMQSAWAAWQERGRDDRDDGTRVELVGAPPVQPVPAEPVVG